MPKKKTKTARRAPTGAEAHERRQQRLEARREARAREVEARRRAERRRRVARALVMGLVGVALVALFLWQTQPEARPDEIGGHTVQKFDETGVNEHVTGTVDYESSPPTSGPHHFRPAPCGVHPEPIRNENQVHSLEHGAIGIQYRPDLDISAIRRIESIARDFESGVFSAPYPDMESAIAVTSWGELMELDSLDVAAIRMYIAEFRGKGPEDATCDNVVDQPFEPAGGDG